MRDLVIAARVAVVAARTGGRSDLGTPRRLSHLASRIHRDMSRRRCLAALFGRDVRRMSPVIPSEAARRAAQSRDLVIAAGSPRAGPSTSLRSGRDDGAINPFPTGHDMSLRSELLKILHQEDINFLLTNRIPRRLATKWMGWFSKIENPAVARAAIAVWRLFADLDLSDARRQSFASLHACFTRELKPGARTVDPDPQRADQPVRRHRRRRAGRSAAPSCCRPRASPTRCRTCWPIRPWSRPTATAPTSRCGSPRACTTASTRRMTARSSG